MNLDAVEVAGSLVAFSEQTDPRLFYAGTWSTVSLSSAFGGTYRQNTTDGASLTICFYGTKLDWLATKGPDKGLAAYTVDGGSADAIDLYSASIQPRQLVRSTGTLANGYHIVRITHMGTKSPANVEGSETAIDIDALEVTGTIIGYAEETDTRLTFAGTWTSVTAASASGGFYKRATGTTATVTIPFVGTSLDLFATKGPSMGSATFSVDGKTPTTASLHNASIISKQKVFATGTLTSGYHTVKMSWSATNAAGTYIGLDAVRVGGTIMSASRFEQTDTDLAYGGTWATVNTASASGSSFKTVNAAGGSVTIDFTGVSLSVMATKTPTYGKMKVTLDGTIISTVDLYSGGATTLYKQTVWSSGYLTPGDHTVKLEWTGTHNAASTGNTIALDAVDVRGVLR